MSSSDHDMSDISNLESPYYQDMESPYSSPSQEVPQLAKYMNILSCGKSYHRGGPYLHIVEQPLGHFRFRYRSEMIGTHGCLLGKSSSTSKTKTHPTVELRNYTGKALIRCRLAQHNRDEEHPHKLLEDDQDRDVSTEVPEGGSYKVGFGGMGIIHTAKKDVPALLFQKFAAELKNFNEKDLRLHCENLAKNINLNIVRLKFSAHDLNTGEEICPPVFSDPIHNMKSAATNDLRMCRVSKCSGAPRGGDDVFVLVEKVNKKNIQIRFYELDSNGEEVWSEKGIFLQSDVHHQYAIVFRTPRYRDLEIANDVKVLFELVRPSDGRTSEPREFTYKANPVYRQNKKRKANSTCSSITSSSGGSLNSLDLPAPVQAANNQNAKYQMDPMGAERMMEIHISAANIPKIPKNEPQVGSNDELMAEALMHGISGTLTLMPTPLAAARSAAPHHGSVGPPVLQLNSAEMENMVNGSISPEERKQFEQMLLNDYPSLDDSFPLIGMTTLLPDSGRAKDTEMASSSQSASKTGTSHHDEGSGKNRSNEYSAYYMAEDGIEVKKLVKELCDMIRNKTANKKQVVRAKLERLFEMRLSNGDTFLHMTLCSNQPSLEYIVKIIHSVRMTHLLNLRNHRMRTILHLAVKFDMPKLVSFLVSKGCDPMAEDNEGNNALHYAVQYQSCLVPLLDAIRSNNVSFDINAYNNEKQTALHLAALNRSEESVQVLLGGGASRSARDALLRTALHLAAYDGALPAARALLRDLPQDEVDAVDGQGNTALQIVCGGEENEDSIEILRLLLDKKADPLKHEEYNKPAWKLCSSKPQMWEIMQKYVSYKTMREEPDIKSEPEDEYESADDDWQQSSLIELSGYIEGLSRLLDLSGSWRALAARLGLQELVPGFAAHISPTRTLLRHLQDRDEYISSETLASTLDGIGEKEAAKTIRMFIVD